MEAQHINITIPKDLRLRLDEEAKREYVARSTLIQKAVKFYLDFIKRKTLRTLLAEGYREMSGESIKITKDFELLDKEADKYVD